MTKRKTEHLSYFLGLRSEDVLHGCMYMLVFDRYGQYGRMRLGACCG